MTQTMPLSEAIRLGSLLKPQGFGCQELRDGPAASCALEAAVEAAGGDVWSLYVEAARLFPVLRQAFACPICACVFEDFITQHGCIVWHLNDAHRWTREEIASWAEGVEREYATRSAQPETERVGAK